MIQNFELTKKINLTNDVYEMVFKWEKELNMKPWQFITFLLEKIWWRAYSILEIKWNEIVLIIKKRELENWGRWWSKAICEIKIWESLKWVGPAGHFWLKDTKENKLFIWTWTWLVPLYNMIIAELEKNNKNNVFLTFWVRKEEDIFYINELEKIKEKYSNFNYKIYISRVKDIHELSHKFNKVNFQSWYTTNYLTKENISKYSEAYICWAPWMIESTIEKLSNLWFDNWENVFFEKY